mgnify:CR=1 FL=1
MSRKVKRSLHSMVRMRRVAPRRGRECRTVEQIVPCVSIFGKNDNICSFISKISKPDFNDSLCLSVNGTADGRG